MPRELTGHKVNPANDVITIKCLDDPGSGGACHIYLITVPEWKSADGSLSREESGTMLSFQDGPIAEVGVNGITHEALLAVLIDRLEHFQKGPYSCRENAIALTKIQEAQHWLHHRTKTRMDRGVEGTHTV